MARSPYYPRRRSRLQPWQSEPPVEVDFKAESRGIGVCSVCDANLPFILSDGLLYLQAPLGCVREEAPKEGCPWVVYMENGASEER